MFNLITNYLFIPKFGYLAAGFTTLASYFVLLLFNYLSTIKFGINKVYDSSRIFLWVCAIIVYAIVCVCLKNMIIIRYLIFILITAFLLKIKFKDLLELVKGLK